MKFPTELSIEIEAFKKSRVPLPTASGRDLIVATRKTYSEGKRDVARASPRFKFQCRQSTRQHAARPDMHERTQAAQCGVAAGAGCA